MCPPAALTRAHTKETHRLCPSLFLDDGGNFEGRERNKERNRSAFFFLRSGCSLFWCRRMMRCGERDKNGERLFVSFVSDILLFFPSPAVDLLACFFCVLYTLSLSSPLEVPITHGKTVPRGFPSETSWTSGEN